MKRYDLRHLHDNFYDRMTELIDEGLKVGEVGIFLFEVGDFSHIQKSADHIKALGHDLMNSLKFNEVDWTIVVKKVDEATRKARAEAVEAARLEAEKAAKAAEEKAKAEAEAKAKAEAEAKAKAEEEAKKAAEAEAKAKAEAEKKAAEEKAKAEAEAKAKAEEEAKKAAEAEAKAKAEAEKKAAEEKAKAEAESKAKAAEVQKAVDTKAGAKKESAEVSLKARNKKSGGKKGAARKGTVSSKKETRTKPSANDAQEDLTIIKGIGKVYMEKLHAEGIYTIEDVSKMSAQQIQIMEEKYSFKGDFKESVADAKKLLKAKAK